MNLTRGLWKIELITSVFLAAVIICGSACADSANLTGTETLTIVQHGEAFGWRGTFDSYTDLNLVGEANFTAAASIGDGIFRDGFDGISPFANWHVDVHGSSAMRFGSVYCTQYAIVSGQFISIILACLP